MLPETPEVFWYVRQAGIDLDLLGERGGHQGHERRKRHQTLHELSSNAFPRDRRRRGKTPGFARVNSVLTATLAAREAGFTRALGVRAVWMLRRRPARLTRKRTASGGGTRCSCVPRPALAASSSSWRKSACTLSVVPVVVVADRAADLLAVVAVDEVVGIELRVAERDLPERRSGHARRLEGVRRLDQEALVVELRRRRARLGRSDFDARSAYSRDAREALVLEGVVDRPRLVVAGRPPVVVAEAVVVRELAGDREQRPVRRSRPGRPRSAARPSPTGPCACRRSPATSRARSRGTCRCRSASGVRPLPFDIITRQSSLLPPSVPQSAMPVSRASL